MKLLNVQNVSKDKISATFAAQSLTLEVTSVCVQRSQGTAGKSAAFFLTSYVYVVWRKDTREKLDAMLQAMGLLKIDPRLEHSVGAYLKDGS